jgi:hypothetical protein
VGDDKVGVQKSNLNPAACLASKLLQPIQIKPIILIRHETDLSVIAALNQVKRNVG